MTFFPLRKRGPIRSPSIGPTTRRPTPITLLPKAPARVAWSSSVLLHEARAAADVIEQFDGLLSILDLPGVKEALESGDLASLLDVLDLIEFLDFEASLTRTMTPRVKDVIAFEGARSYNEVRLMNDSLLATGTGGSGAHPPQLPPTDFADPPPPAPRGRGSFYATTRFDMNNPYAIQQAERFAADLVREISRSTKKAIREAVVDAFRSGVTADNLARRLRNTVGLTSRQALAVERYRERLVNGGLYDDDRIDVLTRRYWRKTRNRRAQTIARTEIMRASNYGRMQGWLSAVDHGMLDANLSVKEWITAPQGPSFDPSKPDVCPTCIPMDHVKVMGVETEFQLPSGRAVQMPPGHPNCRCTAVVWPPSPDYDPEYPHAQV